MQGRLGIPFDLTIASPILRTQLPGSRPGTMRIALAGTQSTGKTTLVSALATRLDDAVVEEEPIRAVARATGEPPPSIPTEAAERRLIEYGSARIERASRTRTTIFDRSPLDAYAHAILSSEMGGPVGTGFLQEMRPRITAALDDLDLVVFVPLDRDLANEDDGFRYLDESGRRRVDRILADLLDPFRPITRTPVLVVRGDVARRTERVMRWIQCCS